MSSVKLSVGLNDSVLLVALLYLIMDIYSEWDRFQGCSRPIHTWLFVSYAAVLSFRIAHLFGAHHSDASALETKDFLLNLRETSKVSWSIMCFTWTLAMPFYGAWTIVGTSWLWTVRQQTPHCLPPGQCWWFIFLWLGVSYLWVLIHLFLSCMACVLELRVRKAEQRLREVADGDVTSRWGNVGQLPGYSALCGGGIGGGLEPSQIASLPASVAGDDCEHECSICLCEVNPGDKIRRLDTCGHCFHRSCIDLWLLRRGDCPLCKRSVALASHTPTPAINDELTILGP